jgi:hypothetical protein
LALFLKISSSAETNHSLWITQKCAELFAERDRVAELALPYNKNAPSHVAKGSNIVLIARFIGGQLLRPKQLTRLRQSGLRATSVPVPKTAVHEYCLPTPRKHDVGTPRQTTAMQPKSVPQLMCQPSHDYFWLRVLSANARHHTATLGRHRRISLVCHVSVERQSLRH